MAIWTYTFQIRSVIIMAVAVFMFYFQYYWFSIPFTDSAMSTLMILVF